MAIVKGVVSLISFSACLSYIYFLIFLKIYLFMCLMYMDASTVHTLAHQKRALDSTRLQIWMVVSHHVGAGN